MSWLMIALALCILGTSLEVPNSSRNEALTEFIVTNGGKHVEIFPGEDKMSRATSQRLYTRLAKHKNVLVRLMAHSKRSR